MTDIHRLLPLLLCVTAVAQEPLGVLHNVPPSFTSRGGVAAANANPVVVFNRLDKESYAGWGYEATAPGRRAIQGLHFIVQDEDLQTPDTFGLAVFTEDPTHSNYPDVSSPAGSLAGLLMPAGTGAGSFDAIASFATPILAPAAADVFCGLDLGVPAATTWPSDGLSVWTLSADSNNAVCDLPGAGIGSGVPDDTFGGYYVASLSLLSYGATRQVFVEPVSLTASGTAGAITNQVSNVPSQTAPGTFSQFSGQYPDARSPSRNPGRMDDLSHRFALSGLPNQTPVFFLIGIGQFAQPELPLGLLVPGSSGVVCLNLGGIKTVGLGFTVGGETAQTLTLPASARLLITGVPLLRQAVALDVATFQLIAGSCARQTL